MFTPHNIFFNHSTLAFAHVTLLVISIYLNSIIMKLLVAFIFISFHRSKNWSTVSRCWLRSAFNQTVMLQSIWWCNNIFSDILATLWNIINNTKVFISTCLPSILLRTLCWKASTPAVEPGSPFAPFGPCNPGGPTGPGGPIIPGTLPFLTWLERSTPRLTQNCPLDKNCSPESQTDMHLQFWHLT